MGGVKSGAGRVAAETGLNAAMGAGLGMVGTAVENPHATWQDYKEGAKHGVISALGMQAVGMAIHKGVEVASREAGVAAKRAAEAETGGRPQEPAPSTAPEPIIDADATKPAAETNGKAPPEEAAPSPTPEPVQGAEPGKPDARVTPRTALPPPPAPEAPLPQQTPEAWAAQQKEYAEYDAQLSPDQQFTALRREFPEADPRALARIVAEFDSEKGFSLSTLVREKLGLPDPNRPAGNRPATLPESAGPTPARTSTTVNNKPLIKGSAMDRWADRVIKNARGNLNMAIDPVVQSAYAIKGAALIESGLRTFAEWSHQMVKEFGEIVRPHLEDLWQRSGEHLTKTPGRPFNQHEGKAISMSDGATAVPTSRRKQRKRGGNHTRQGTVRKNAQDWRATRGLWDALGYGELLSKVNRERIGKGRAPIVDDAWIAINPEDAGLAGEKISMHHVQGLPISAPLPKSRHIDAHMPGGFRYNAGGPGSQLPIYPTE